MCKTGEDLDVLNPVKMAFFPFCTLKLLTRATVSRYYFVDLNGVLPTYSWLEFGLCFMTFKWLH